MSDETRRKILVTGGAGFIGSTLVDRLMEQGHQVTVFDNLSSGLRRWIDAHIGHERFTFIEADLRDYEAVRKAVAGQDVVWHLGANTDIRVGHDDTATDLVNGVVATHNVLEAMRTTGVRDLLFASSGSIYGEVDEIPTPEGAGPLMPLSLYAAGKLGAEVFISAYAHLFGIHAWVFRFGNVIGERMGHGVIFDFVMKLRSDPTGLEVLGNGMQEKNYFLVEECLDGMTFAFENVALPTEHPMEIFNLGTNTTSKVTEIAQIVKEEMGLAAVQNHFTGGERGWPGDQPKVYLNVDKVNQRGWRAQRTSNEAVRIAARRVIDLYERGV